MRFIKQAKKPRLGMRSVLIFGKYKGTTIKEIIADDPTYIRWCIEHSIFTLNSYARNTLNCSDEYYPEEEFGWDPLWD